jgi:hypothetical protein
LPEEAVEVQDILVASAVKLVSVAADLAPTHPHRLQMEMRKRAAEVVAV